MVGLRARVVGAAVLDDLTTGLIVREGKQDRAAVGANETGVRRIDRPEAEAERLTVGSPRLEEP